MRASTTQDTLVDTTNGIRKDSSARGTPNQLMPTLGIDDVNSKLEDEYGAWWGSLKFEDTLSDYSNEARPFIYVDDTVDLRDLRQFIMTEWKLQAPNIVISILSGATHHKPMRNLKTAETLKSGIKNAANASEVWFITNGLDAGMPQLIGSAFRDEIVRKFLKKSFRHFIYLNRHYDEQMMHGLYKWVGMRKNVKNLF